MREIENERIHWRRKKRMDAMMHHECTVYKHMCREKRKISARRREREILAEKEKIRSSIETVTKL